MRGKPAGINEQIGTCVAGLHGEEQVDRLCAVLRRARGACPVELHVRDTQGRKARLRLPEAYRVNPANLPMDELESLLGANGIGLYGIGITRNGNGH